MSPEFNLIDQFFTKPCRHTDLSIGDDAALLQVQAEHQLVVSSDMLVSGTHFFPDADPELLGWKTLAVNLSDIAAMGATPKWATLSLALPNIDESWLADFAKGFFRCANTFNIDLIGGDTTKGPLAFNVTIMGEVPKQQALNRNGAKPNEDIWVSGQLGNAAFGLQYLQNKIAITEPYKSTVLAALHQPQPRCTLGLALRGLASSCIDLSDGLLADLGHILKASNLGATLQLADIPVLTSVATPITDNKIQATVLAGGEDYELCFTSSQANRETIQKLSQALNLPITCIGQTTTDKKLQILHNQQTVSLMTKGYDHFT